MKLIQTIPAMPVASIEHSAEFYRDKLEFTIVHQEPEFALLRRDEIEVHLWGTSDESWKTRAKSSLQDSPISSGAESFIAGTASFRVGVLDVDELFEKVKPLGILHNNGKLEETYWGTREFHVLDPDGNLITFFERIEVQPSNAN